MPMGDVFDQSANLRFPKKLSFLDHFVEKLSGGDAMCCVMRACVYATGFRIIVAKIATGSLANHLGFFLRAFLAGAQQSKFFAHRPVHAELLQIDVAVGTIVGALRIVTGSGK